MAMTRSLTAVVALLSVGAHCFTFLPQPEKSSYLLLTKDTETTDDNKAMAFLRSKGLIGHRRDYTNAIGIDEGPAGKESGGMRKKTNKKMTLPGCAQSGVVDDCTLDFPSTSSGTEWIAFSDRIFGGRSIVNPLCRSGIKDRVCTVLQGQVMPTGQKVETQGFIQMATSLHPCMSVSVDLSRYEGVELQVLSRVGEQLNVHLKTPSCLRFSAYRAALNVPTDGEWHSIKIPWTTFSGFGDGAQDVDLDPSVLKRIGVVVMANDDKTSSVHVAVSKIGFY